MVQAISAGGTQPYHGRTKAVMFFPYRLFGNGIDCVDNAGQQLPVASGFISCVDKGK
jgi:hypothetical protein